MDPLGGRVDIRARALGERQLANLVTLTGLQAQRAHIETAFGTLLDELPDMETRPAPSGTLTASGYPVELGVTIDRSGALGLKCTVDLSSSCASNVIDTLRRRRIPQQLSRDIDDAHWPLIERCTSSVLERATGSGVGVYVSAGFARDRDPRMRMYLIGHDGAFGPHVIRDLEMHGCDSSAVDAVLRAAEAVGRPAINFIGLGVTGQGRLRCKAYLATTLFIDLRSLTRLASALDLSTGRALALVRWYRHFIGDHIGQLGAFGVGIDLTAPAGCGAVEAYAYPGNVDLAGFRARVAALARRRGHANTLTRLWGLLDGTSGSPGGMYLAGCGTETATFARFGQMTVYLGISPTL